MRAGIWLYFQMSVLLLFLTAIIVFHYWKRGLHRFPEETTWHVPVSDSARGRLLLKHHGCGACHVIPGVPNATGKVGPRLDRIKEKIYLAGVLPHTPQNLIVWIQTPQDVDPRTAMPNLGISDRDVRDMAAFLYESQ